MARITEETDAIRPTRPVIVNTFPGAASADAASRAYSHIQSWQSSFRTYARPDQGAR
jgi:hypothetical protein